MMSQCLRPLSAPSPLRWLDLGAMPLCEPMNMVSVHRTSMQNTLWKKRREKQDKWKFETGQIERGRALAMHTLRKPSVCHRRHHAAAPGGSRGAAWDKPRPASNNTLADPANLKMTVFKNKHMPRAASFSPIRSATREGPQQPDGGTHLAVRGADRKPDVGGNHHGERGGQLDGEAAAGGRARYTSQALFVSASQTPQGCQSLTRTFFGSIVGLLTGQMTLTEKKLLHNDNNSH